MNEAVDGCEGHSLIWEDLSPLAEGLVCGNHQGSPFISGADQFEEHPRFGLVLGDISDVVEDQELIFVELGDRRFEDEIAPRDLELLDEIGRSGEEDALAVFNQGEAERGSQV